MPEEMAPEQCVRRALRCCRRIADHLMAGEPDRASACFTYPLAVFLPGGFRIERDPAMTARVHADRRAVASATGATRIAVQIDAVLPVRDARWVVDLVWHYETADGVPVASCAKRYFCNCSDPAAPRVEMVEEHSAAFPTLGPDIRHLSGIQ